MIMSLLTRKLEWRFSRQFLRCVRLIKHDTTSRRSEGFATVSGEARNTALSCPVSFDFTNTEKIFKTRSTSEILRSLLVLSLCSVDALADNAEKLMRVSEKIFGKRLFEYVMQKTFYGQFVAGKDKQEVHDVGQRLREAGIRTMLYIPIEADDPESIITDFKACDEKFDKNLEMAMESIKSTEPGEFTQLRITPFCSPQLLRDLTMRLDPYKHSTEKPDHLTLQSFAQGLDKNFMGQIIPDLDDGSNEHLRRSLVRLDKLAECAKSCGVRLMIDSEHTYMQAAISHLIMTMQFKYNRVTPIVFNTYQAYLKDTAGRVDTDLRLLHKSGVIFGTKLVRGAYMDLERRRAVEHGYEDPILPSAEATHISYDGCVERIMEGVVRGQAQFMVATHNQTSVQKALKRMDELQISPSDGTVVFGQIYGMCDQLSYALGTSGFPVYKSIPYGTIEDTLLYLTRRAAENKTVIAGTRNEKKILWKELTRRVLAGN